MSVIAEALRHMLAAGMAHDDIVRAVSAMEIAAAPVRTARQDRNARYYSKRVSEKRLNASNSDVSDVSDAPSPKERKVSPHPSKETQPSPSTPSHPSDAPAPKAAADRGSRLTADWLPTPADWAFAVSELGEPMAAREAEKFRNYWLSKSGKDGRKVDWSRTWRNWVMSAKDRFGGKNGRVGQERHHGGAPRSDPVIAALARRIVGGAGSVHAVAADDPFSFGLDPGSAGPRGGPIVELDLAPQSGPGSGDREGRGDGPRLYALQGRGCSERGS